MLPTSPLLGLALTLTLPALLLAGCAHESPLCKPTPEALIPPLPAQAKQTDSPTHSMRAQQDIQTWLLPSIDPSLPDKPAKLHTDR